LNSTDQRGYRHDDEEEEEETRYGREGFGVWGEIVKMKEVGEIASREVIV
jgi:hypothetical protein